MTASWSRLTIAFCLCSTLNALADQTAAKEGEGLKDEKQWMDYVKPSEGHKMFNELVGTWKHTVRFWANPKAMPESSEGTTVNKIIMGGRFLRSEATGKVMGKTFEGLGITAFDNIRKEYQSMWIDNMATGMMLGTANYDAAAKTLRESGTMSDPMTLDKGKIYRAELKLVDKKNYTYEMFTTTPDGKEFAMMKISYKKTN